MKRKQQKRLFFVCLLSFVFPSMPLYSQDFPSAGSELHRQQQQDKLRQRPFQLPDLDKVSTSKGNKNNNVTLVYIKDFILKGEISEISQSEIYEVVAGIVGKKIEVAKLIHEVEKITQLYRSRGFILAKAVLPPQDITAGIITIFIQEGKLDTSDGGVKINTQGTRLNIDFARKIFTNAMPKGQAVHQQQLERGALLLNDLSGVRASVNLEPGSVPGTTRVVLDVDESAIVSSRVSWDNNGSRLTGTYKGGVTVNVHNLTGYGDQLSTTYQGALDGGALHYVRTQGTMPIGHSGFKLGTSFQYLAYEAGKEFENLDAKGDAIQWGINAEYPIIRSRKANLWVKAEFVQKILEDEALANRTNHKLLNIGNLGLTASYSDGFLSGGYTQVNILGHYGSNDLSGLKSSYQADQSATGAKTDGNFFKGNINLRRLQRITDDTHLIANVSGQLGSKNLSSSEKFQLGGISGVRAYPTGEGSGDHGVVVNIDGIYTLFRDTAIGKIDLVAFYDWGRVQQFNNADKLILSSPNNYNLSGYGASVKINQSERFNIDLTIAKRIGKNPAKNRLTGKDSDGSLDDLRFWFNLSYSF